jgi:putative ABC transport system substrate-binding protein
MELLKETLPRISRVAVLWHPATEAGQVRVSEAAAESLGLRIHALKVERFGDLATTFAEAQKHHAEGLIVLSSPFLYAHRARLVELAAKLRLPTMYHQREFVIQAGGFMSYGPNLRDLFRRAATYVDKVLKGVRPADLPVEQPTQFELVINLKTAKALGLTIPPSVLARADEVVQ